MYVCLAAVERLMDGVGVPAKIGEGTGRKEL